MAFTLLLLFGHYYYYYYYYYYYTVLFIFLFFFNSTLSLNVVRAYDANFVQSQLSNRDVPITSSTSETRVSRFLGPKRPKFREIAKFPQMADALKEWLHTRSGVIMDLSPDAFGRYTSDGVMLAEILHSYDIITNNQLKTIIRTWDPTLSRVNLRTLRIWLKLINVTLSDECIEDISKVSLAEKAVEID
ncbi:uncharacterized protein LOC114255011 [Monomorium pharaonis]|uniref:uncharacterized protein LOC114255011 n=1 Tax=Monomorium pharaonis TaxID=307658 RepID=UPI001746B856|nr:uncharacterized protein LOC114255011 [Monomorium pharaonis]